MGAFAPTAPSCGRHWLPIDLLSLQNFTVTLWINFKNFSKKQYLFYIDTVSYMITNVKFKERINLNEWYHLAFAFSKQRMDVYINSKLELSYESIERNLYVSASSIGILFSFLLVYFKTIY